MVKSGWGDPKFFDDAQEVETDFFKFEKVGDTLVGQLLEKGEAPVRGEMTGRYTFVTEDGRNVACHGATQMDDKMAFVSIGSVVRIEYTGDQKTPNGAMKLFSVRERFVAATGS